MKQQSKLEYKDQGGRWPFVLTAPFSYATPESDFTVECFAGEKLLATFHDFGIAVIYPGYAIDGATAPWPFKQWLERPDSMDAFFKHDIACQFQWSPHFRLHALNRREADYMLYDDLASIRHPLAIPSLVAVRLAARAKPKRGDSLSVTLINPTTHDETDDTNSI